MGYNGHTGQLIGYFKANEDIMALIQADAKSNVNYIQHLGIQSEDDIVVMINDKEIHIGKTRIYEIGDVEVVSLYLTQDSKDSVIIDYTIKLEE